MKTIEEAWVEGSKFLSNFNIINPYLEVRLLLCAILKFSHNEFLINNKNKIIKSDYKLLKEFLIRRSNSEPISRIIKNRSFWKHDFLLGPEVLDPRNDSEILVECCLDLSRQIDFCAKDPIILELGTGSGCLILSLLKEMKLFRGIGTDISYGALKVAKENALRMGLDKKISFICGDWLEALDGIYDIVLVNPPYIPSNEIKYLMPEVALFDPIEALDGGKDGLEAYKIIIPKLKGILKKKSLVLMEIGTNQSKIVRKYFIKAGFPVNKGTYFEFKDLSGQLRCVAMLQR